MGARNRMDSMPGFDDDEHFFGSYDAERANVGMSLAELEFDAEALPATHEQLAHLARFRTPVAFIVATMALFSVVAPLVALERRGSQRQLVAHYGSAIAAPTPAGAATATVAQTAEASSTLVFEASSAASAVAPGLATSGTDPWLDPASPDSALTGIFIPPDSNPVSAFISALRPMCLGPAASGGGR